MPCFSRVGYMAVTPVLCLYPHWCEAIFRVPLECSKLRCEREDFSAHPKAKEVQFFECVAGPGDSLYIPQGWWHYLLRLPLSKCTCSQRGETPNLVCTLRSSLDYP